MKNTHLHDLNFFTVENAIDFPSAFAIIVHFRAQEERRDSNLFSGQSLVKFTDLPQGNVLTRKASEKTRRLY